MALEGGGIPAGPILGTHLHLATAVTAAVTAATAVAAADSAVQDEWGSSYCYGLWLDLCARSTSPTSAGSCVVGAADDAGHRARSPNDPPPLSPPPPLLEPS